MMALKQPADGGVAQHSASLFRALSVTAAFHRTSIGREPSSRGPGSFWIDLEGV